MKGFTGVLALAIRDGVPRRSLQTALVVGSILTAINQGDIIVTGQMPNFLKIVLNYMVPFCVATYGAVTMKNAMQSHGDEASTGR